MCVARASVDELALLRDFVRCDRELNEHRARRLAETTEGDDTQDQAKGESRWDASL
jgi:hypothetical protein